MIKVGRPRKKFQVHMNPTGYLEAVYWHRGQRFRRKLHRLLMEKKLGRKLKPDEEIDHKDHDRTNNRMSNLRVMTRSAHRAHENKYRTEKGEYQGAVKEMLLRRIANGSPSRVRQAGKRSRRAHVQIRLRKPEAHETHAVGKDD